MAKNSKNSIILQIQMFYESNVLTIYLYTYAIFILFCIYFLLVYSISAISNIRIVTIRIVHLFTHIAI